MANPYVLSFTLLDANGVKTSTPVYYLPTAPSTVTVANVITDWAAIGDALDDATNAQILGGKISFPVDAQAGWKSAPVAENDVSDVIVLNFNNAVNRYAQEFLVPAFLEAMLTGGQVDLSNAALAALFALLETGGLTNGSAANTGSNLLTSLRDAFQADRKHRRQLRNKSIATP